MNRAGCDHKDEILLYHNCEGIRETPSGVHALVIGVSRYEKRQRSGQQAIRPLLGAATGAAHFARFLITDFHDPSEVPVRTVRLLLSPEDGEDQLLPVQKNWQEATHDNVADADDAWENDCDSNPNNIAILYPAGHGIITPTGYQFVFLSGAGRVQNAYSYGVNLGNIRERMRFNSARTNICIFDCCALRGADLPQFTGDAGIGAGLQRQSNMAGRPEQDVQAPHPGRDNEVIIAARVGTQNYVLNAREGTLMSLALVGSNEVRPRPPLLQSAGTIVADKTFAVTPYRLKQKFLPTMRYLRPRAYDAGEEPLVHPETDSIAITKPEPPPLFRVTLISNPPPTGYTFCITIFRRDGTIVDGAEARDQGLRFELILEAGVYELALTPYWPGARSWSRDLPIWHDGPIGLEIDSTGRITLDNEG